MYLIRNRIQQFVAANYTFLPEWGRLNSCLCTRQQYLCRLRNDSQLVDLLIPPDLWSCGRLICRCLTRKDCFKELQKQKMHPKTFPGRDKIGSVWRRRSRITAALQGEYTLVAPCWGKCLMFQFVWAFYSLGV